MLDLNNGGTSVDDRGKLMYLNEVDFSSVKRFYVVSNHQANFVRAWHGHRREGKFVFVPKGAAIVAKVDMESHERERVILSESHPRVLYIPPGHYNGFRTLTDDTQVMFFSTSTLEESAGDDERLFSEEWPEMLEVVER